MPSASRTASAPRAPTPRWRVLRGLVRGEAVTLAGGTRLELAPGAESPPIWIGGMGEAARRRAVLHGDAWFPSMLGPDEVAAGAAQLAAAAEAHGRDRAPAIAAGGAVLLGDPVDRAALDAHVASLVDGYGLPPDVAGRVPLTGPPARVAERLAAYAQVGPSHMVLGLIGEDWRAQCELLAEAVRLVPDGRAEAPPGQAARPARAVRPAGAA